MEKSEVAVLKEAWELSEFETEYVPIQAMPVKWSIEKFKVAQMLALSGKTKKETAKALGLPLAVIERWLESAEFKEYMDSLVQDAAKSMKNARLQMLNKILQARIDQAETEGYADASRKDTLDIIAELRKETGDDKNSGGGNLPDLLESLMRRSLEHQPKIITLEEGK